MFWRIILFVSFLKRLLVIIFIYISNVGPPFPVSPLQTSILFPSPSHLRGCLPLASPSPEHQVSTGLGHILSLWGQTWQSIICYICACDLGAAHVCSWVGGSVSGSSQVSWHCCSSYGVAIPFSSFNPSPNSSIGAPGLCPVLSISICICLGQLQVKPLRGQPC